MKASSRSLTPLDRQPWMNGLASDFERAMLSLSLNEASYEGQGPASTLVMAALTMRPSPSNVTPPKPVTDDGSLYLCNAPSIWTICEMMIFFSASSMLFIAASRGAPSMNCWRIHPCDASAAALPQPHTKGTTLGRKCFKAAATRLIVATSFSTRFRRFIPSESGFVSRRMNSVSPCGIATQPGCIE